MEPNFALFQELLAYAYPEKPGEIQASTMGLRVLGLVFRALGSRKWVPLPEGLEGYRRVLE